MLDTGAVQLLQVSLKPESNGEYERRARILGEVWAIKVLCGQLTGTWADLKSLYDPAIRHHRIRIFYNSMADPIGYLAWAHLAPDVEERWMRHGTVKLHLSEWTEGDQLWIVDGMVAPGYAADVVSVALRDLFPNSPSVRLAKTKPTGCTFKHLERVALERFVARLSV